MVVCKCIRVQLDETNASPGVTCPLLLPKHVHQITLGNGQYVDGHILAILDKRLRSNGVEYQVGFLFSPFPWLLIISICQ
jgi:hypothetical protein